MEESSSGTLKCRVTYNHTSVSCLFFRSFVQVFDAKPKLPFCSFALCTYRIDVSGTNSGFQANRVSRKIQPEVVSLVIVR